MFFDFTWVSRYGFTFIYLLLAWYFNIFSIWKFLSYFEYCLFLIIIPQIFSSETSITHMFDLIHMTLQCHHFLRSHFVFLHSFCVLFNLHTFSTNMWSQSFKLSNTVIANDNIFISNIDIFVSIKNIYIYINKEFINIFYIFLIH